MRQSSSLFATLVAIVAVVFLAASCNSKGVLVWSKPVAGDNSGGGTTGGGGTDGGGTGGGGTDGGGTGGGGTGGGGSGGGTTDTRFSGTWMASFGDDLPIGGGARQYAMRLVLTQSDTDITGTGSMVRFYNSGSTAFDNPPTAITVKGTASGDDATLTLSGASGVFTSNPVWYMHLADSKLVGLYAERDANFLVQRSGSTMWYPVGAPAVAGSWISSFGDQFATGGGYPARDRTGVVSLASANGDITGLGSYVEQRANDVSLEYSYDVTSGAISGSQVDFSFTGFDPAIGDVDWFGYHSGTLIVGAYGQFNDNNQLARFGHATWYKAGTTAPTDYQRDWVTSFGDSSTPNGLYGDYLMAMSGVTVDNNTLTGTVRVLNETDPAPSFATYSIENGVIVGSELNMDVVRGSDRFTWNLRVGGSILAGSYTHYGANDAYLGRGHAEWRYGVTSNLAGTYVGAFFDTSTTNATENRASQQAIITIAGPDSNGKIDGTGSLRLASEKNRRQFSINGFDTGKGRVIMAWSGADLFGKTVWNLRKAGKFLYATYTNYASDNQTIEFQGHAMYVKASGN